jgi:cAMP-dependent protein kinase regulator
MGCSASKQSETLANTPDITLSSSLNNGSNQRRSGFSAQPVTEKDLLNFIPPVFPKSEEQKAKIYESLQRLHLLFDLNHAEKIVDAFKSVDIEEGTEVITQGDSGDLFYLVEEGKFQVVKNSVIVAEITNGGYFGELALIFDAPRAATVKAMENSKVFVLDRDTFKYVTIQTASKIKKEQESFIRGISIFSDLKSSEICQLVDILQEETFITGQDIITQGSVGDKFYILAEGSCTAYIDGDKGRVPVKEYFQGGQYFGELALINLDMRRASVVAGCEGCTVYTVNQMDFNRVLGPIKFNDNYPTYEETYKLNS